jgi:hypothetical protein
MNSLKLTRYLYNLEEVKLKYYISIFSKKDLNECYFWIYEIYLSDLKDYTIDIIFNLYYEFYAILNPNVERKMNELIQSEEDIELIPAKLTKILFKLEFNYDVFSVIQLVKNIHNKFIKNNIINQLYELVSYNKKIKCKEYLKPFNIIYHNLFDNIYKKNYLNICISLSLFIFNIEKSTNKTIELREIDELIELYNNLIKFKKNVIKNDLIYYFSSMNLKNDNNYNSNNIIYKIIILVFDIYYSLLNKKILLNDIKDDIYSLNIKEIKYIFSLNEEDINFRKEKIYNVLKRKRQYFIHQNNYEILGSFNLLRYNYFSNEEEYILDTLSNWEYYCYETPIWFERFKMFNITRDVERKKIVFENDINDEKYENFYQKYGYELDEQSSLVYDLYYIDKCNYNNWFNFLYEMSSKNIQDNNETLNINVKININNNNLYNSNKVEGINYINEYYKYINENINENINNIELKSENLNNDLNNDLIFNKNINIYNKNNINKPNNIFDEIKIKININNKYKIMLDIEFELFC